MSTQASPSGRVDDQDTAYTDFLHRLQSRFLQNVSDNHWLLFETDADNLWDSYLDALGPAPVAGQVASSLRQSNTCHACRQFIQRYGGLVTVDEVGQTHSALWDEDDAPESLRPAVAALAKRVRKAKVTGVFLSSERVWGTPVTGSWHHLSLTPPANILYSSRVKTAGQAMAEKLEDFKTVVRALQEFKRPHLETAVTLLKTDALYRSEKLLGQAEWLLKLHVDFHSTQGSRRSNIVWRAVALAPAGFCHPRSGMIGTLLEDLAAGMDYNTVEKRFAAKIHPLAYQRPQAPPSAGNIQAAEKLVQQLGVEKSLARRFARLDEIQTLWKPSPVKDQLVGTGVFSHLKPKTEVPTPALEIPAQTMTWEKFQRTVLPSAERIELRAPQVGAYTALVTAVHADAPPILQWDREEARNPVSWYFWERGSPASQFGLKGGSFVEVEAVTFQPSMWNGGNTHQGQGVMFVLAGARESRNPGLVLFPEFLKAELHGIRAVIEAHSKTGRVEGLTEPHAAGVMFSSKGGRFRLCLRVRVSGQHLLYTLDRWD